MKKNIKNKILGLITICINVSLLYFSLDLYYGYNFTNNLYLFMYPNWVVLVNALFGLIGIFMSIMIYIKKVSVKLFLIGTLLLWLIVFTNYNYSYIWYSVLKM